MCLEIHSIIFKPKHVVGLFYETVLLSSRHKTPTNSFLLFHHKPLVSMSTVWKENSVDPDSWIYSLFQEDGIEFRKKLCTRCADFQQCGILISVDSDEPVQLRNLKWCSVCSFN